MKIFKIIFSLLILGASFAFSFYLRGIFGVLSFILMVSFYTILFYFLSILWKKLRKKPIIDSGVFILNFLFSVSIFILIVGGSISGFSYYANEFSPAKLNQYTISNGEKTVIFQSMVHIGSKEFYENVKENIEKAKEDGFVYFYEGVRAGTQKNHETFNQLLGVDFNKDLYLTLSKLYGLEYQNQADFMDLVNQNDENIDVSMDQIIEKYIEKNGTGAIEKDIQVQTPVNVNKEITQVLDEINERELGVLVYINKAILNTLLGSEKFMEMIEGFGSEKLFDIILNERNKVLADAIINSKNNKIFVTYGGLHFEGVLKLLQKNDPKWKIIKIKSYFPIQ